MTADFDCQVVRIAIHEAQRENFAPRIFPSRHYGVTPVGRAKVWNWCMRKPILYPEQ